MTATIAVHSLLARSEANGPGLRSVVWVQGCSLACEGCFNPLTHEVRSATGGTSTADLADWVVRNDVEGLTVTGGEPLEQAGAVLDLGRRVREAGLGVVILTGFTWTEVVRMVSLEELTLAADAIITGRYRRDLHIGTGLRGSSNKQVRLLSTRYTPHMFAETPVAEVTISVDGTVLVTGVDVPVLEEAP